MNTRPISKEQDGTVSFKVTLLKSYRVIKVSFNHTLKDLHNAIQDAFEFDNDHLYAFHMDGDKRSRHNAYYSDHDEAPYASETFIRQFGWAVGQKFIYHFDFGDDWIFSCRVMEVDPDEVMNDYPKVVKTKGELPVQYPTDEDEEEEGDW